MKQPNRFALLRDRKGVSALEFAFIGPLLLFICFGLINLSDLAWTYTALHNGVVEAARYAAVQSNTALSNARSGAIDGTTCVGPQAIQTVFAKSVAGPIIVGSVPNVAIAWGGTLVACNVSTGNALVTTVPGGTVMVSAQFGWRPLAMPAMFGPLTIHVNATQSVMEAPAS